jgi:transcriptional regulator with GAF, ATPase, and Fis domain/Tfp pilus assembly protein PilF
VLTKLAGGAGEQGRTVNGRWRLDQVLGEGADATTWSALDESSGRRVALKALKRLARGEARERFRWEFARLASVEHPGLVRVFDLDVAGAGGPLVEGQPFFTAELCDGPPPSARLAAMEGKARARALCQLLAEIGAALEALHLRGLVHHDVKPGNLLSDGEARFRLADLGLATARGLGDGLRGTPAFLAPEGFLGDAGPRGDLYALGATAFELWSGRRLRAGRTLAELWAESRAPAPPIDAPTGLAGLIGALLAVDPAARPSSARQVVDEAVRLGARLDGGLVQPPSARTLLPPRLCGREAALADAQAALDDAGVVLIAGEPGSGRGRFVEELRRRVQITALAADRAARPFVAAAPAGKGGDEKAARLEAARLSEQLRRAPQVVHLDLSAGTGPFARELLALAARGAARPSTVIAEVPADFRLPDAARIELDALDETATAELVCSMLGASAPELSRAIHKASSGWPRLAVELLRAAAMRARSGAPPTAADVRALDAADAGALASAALERLEAPARQAAFALTVLGRPATVDELAGLLDVTPSTAHEALRAAEAAGLVEVDAQVRFPSRAHADAVAAALPRARAEAWHRRALARATGERDRARHLLALDEPGAARAALDGGRTALAAGDLDEGCALLAAAVERGDAQVGRAARLALASAQLARADQGAATETVEPLGRDPEAELLRARASQRSGDAAAAEQRLGRVLKARALDPSLRADALGLLGRVLLARGAYDQIIESCPLDGSVAATPALAEARGLALLYVGRLDEAEAAFRVGEARAADTLERARAHALLGMVAQARDRLGDAGDAYQQALELARAAGDLHAAAIYAANLGATLREQAEYARALPPTEDAVRELGWLGKDAERSSALFNLGNLLLSMGDADGADAAATQALTLARSAGAAREAGYALLLAADVARRRGEPAVAVEKCVAAGEAFAPLGAKERVLALRNLAEALADARRPDDAARTLTDALKLARPAGLDELTAITQVRLALDADKRPGRAAVAALEAAAARAAERERRDLAFRAFSTLARAHVRAGALSSALAALDAASIHWKEILMRTPELRRAAAAEDPDARRLRELQAAVAAPPVPTHAPDPAPFRRLIAINKRLNSELRLPRLLELILDTVIELTSAERGFVLLADPSGALQVSLARNIDQKTLEAGAGEVSFSRSIAERAAREATPIVTLDAAGDERFEAALSVSHLKLRSVIAVPLSVKGRVVGCVYADHRLRAAAFGEADVQLVVDLAEQAAIAIENARLLEENEAKRHEVAQLAAELERKVADQALELGELHREVRSSRAALSVRYDYDNLVGKTPRMLELFRLLDRVTETALPVVIYGESGTGKELVARALHHNGPRRGKPFVSESCAAIPETLLEAALFGHVRGAFTGADSERRGLFEIAHGGTLFLDEVGEMPPSMQVKLLRVLQSGEFRRVGGERTLKVDVRLLVASNRDLGRLVEEGRFREDLYYRLNVVRVALPPLRERRDDVPLLVEHFLRKHAGESGQPPRKIARAALHKLVGYRWPGNVRELENEVLRAASLGGETLTVADLSPQVAAGEPEAAVDSPDDLTMRIRVERLERTLLREALGRAGGNQSQAARMLGLSRFGLQKKLKRYHL